MTFQPCGVVAFLSDFGLADGYVAEVHGAILAGDPSVRVIDVTHEVPPQDIRTGAWLLRRVRDSFPAGTVFLAVVDPGVGSSRRPVVAFEGGRAFVGPDNGLLSWAAGPGAAWARLDRPDLCRLPLSQTFHGRDLFGPLAGALASGRLAPDQAGPRVGDPAVLSFPTWTASPGRAAGQVLHVDRFGNLLVSVPADALPPDLPEGAPVSVVTRGAALPARRGTYGATGTLAVHADSSGFVEVALAGGRADRALGAGVGDPLEVTW
jgi:S-adenosyl-L-methionine hydrolase (adenosine-forming)